MNKDYYGILGVPKTATEQDIKKAYHKLSMQTHPDRQHGKTDAEKKEAEEKFKDIAEAYSVLSDKEKRQHYDNFGTTDGNFTGFGPGGIDPREFFRQHASHFHGFNPFDAGFGFDDAGFENSFIRDPNAPKDGRNVKISVQFDLEDILYGSKKEFTINVNDPCEHCHGTGAKDGKLETCPVCHGHGMECSRQGIMMVRSTCRNCYGSGFVVAEKCPHCNNGTVQSKRDLSVNIPQGINVGQKLRLENCGEHGTNGGKNGDIFIIVDQKHHDIFERRGLDLIEKVFISPITASLGGEVDVQTPWGVSVIEIPKNTQSGDMFKLLEQGVRCADAKGDLYVFVEVETLANLSKDQIKLLKKLENTLSSDNLNKTCEFEKKCECFRDRIKNIAK